MRWRRTRTRRRPWSPPRDREGLPGAEARAGPPRALRNTLDLFSSESLLSPLGRIDSEFDFVREVRCPVVSRALLLFLLTSCVSDLHWDQRSPSPSSRLRVTSSSSISSELVTFATSEPRRPSSSSRSSGADAGGP